MALNPYKVDAAVIRKATLEYLFTRGRVSQPNRREGKFRKPIKKTAALAFSFVICFRTLAGSEQRDHEIHKGCAWSPTTNKTNLNAVQCYHTARIHANKLVSFSPESFPVSRGCQEIRFLRDQCFSGHTGLITLKRRDAFAVMHRVTAL